MEKLDDQLAPSASSLSLKPAGVPPRTTAAPTTFLDLPFEIRLAVYEHFATIPPKSSVLKSRKNELWTVEIDKGPSKKPAEGGQDSAGPVATTAAGQDPLPSKNDNNSVKAPGNLESHNVITDSRRALLLTCKKIHEEWNPLFWSTTTIVLGMASHTDPATFERQFLARVDERKLSAIRHMIYSPLKWKTEVGNHLRSIECDCFHIGVLKLGRVLQTWPALLGNLEDIRVVFEPKCPLPAHYALEARRGETVEDKWTAMDPTRVWDSLVAGLNVQGNSWNVEQSIGFAPFRIAEAGGVYCWIAARWQMFCKRVPSLRTATA